MRAGTVRGVEGEAAGGQLLEGGPVVGAGQVLAEGQCLGPVEVRPVPAAGAAGRPLTGRPLTGRPLTGRPLTGHDLDLGDPLSQAERRLQRVGQAALDPLSPHQPVDHHLDGVLLVAGQLDLVGELVDLAVDPGAGVALRGEVGQEGVVGALAPAHHRGEDLEPGALGQLEDAVHDLLGCLPGDDRAALRAVGHPDPGVEKAQVVVDLCDGADRGAGVPGGRLLVDRYRRRQPLYEVDVGLVHLTQELAGVGGERFDVAPLAFRVDRVEGQGGLARP